MNNLWNQTFDLFRRNPVLWIPSSIATVLVLVLKKLETAGLQWLTQALAIQHEHSVFGDYTQSTHTDQTIVLAMKIAIPVGLIRDFSEICLVVVALAATKNLVQMVLNQQAPQLAAALKEVVPRFRDVLVFSAKYMAIMGISGGLLLLISTDPSPSHPMRQWAESQTEILMYSLAAEAVLAWLLLPSAMRLLRPNNGSDISLGDRRTGTLFAIAAALAPFGLEFMIKRAEATLLVGNQWQAEAVRVMNTLIINLPQVLLFIALALLAIQRPDQPEEVSLTPPSPDPPSADPTPHPEAHPDSPPPLHPLA